MNEKQQQLTFDKGITNVPSDALCSDNALEESLGMVYENGEHRVIQKPIVKSDYYIGSGETLLYVHSYNGVVRLIVKDSTNVCWRLVGDSYHTLHNIVAHDNSKVLVESIGNTLIVSTSNGLNYLLWDYTYETYKIFGNHMPDINVEFKLDNFGETTYPENYISLAGMLDGVELIPMGPVGAKFRDGQYDNAKTALIGLVSSRLKKVKELKRFAFPFWVRYAIRLYDGSHVSISNPILMVPTVTNNSNIFACEDDGTIKPRTADGEWPKANYKPISAKLLYSITVPNDISNWQDIISGIDIFISDEVKNFDMEGEWRIINTGDINGVIHQYTEAGEVIVDNCLPEYFKRDVYPEFDISDTSTWLQYYAPTLLSEADIVDRLVGNSVFYKVIELDFDDLTTQTDVDTTSKMPSNVLVNLTTQTQLEYDDYFGRTNIVPQVMKTYNHRLHMANITRDFFGGFVNFSYTKYSSISSERDITFYVYIKSESGERIVEAVRSDAIPEIADIWFYYPDPRAYMVDIFDGNYGVKRLSLKEHPYLHGAYYFKRLPGENEIEPSTSLTKPTPNGNVPELLRDQLVVSEVDNPYIFTAKGYTNVGIGMITGLATQTMALDENEHGIHPMTVFSEKGISLLRLNNEGVYIRSDEISREVANPDNPCIIETDGPVYFASKRGLMVLVGQQVKCVSDQLSGRDANFDGEIDLGNFVDYLRTAFIAYDYRDSLLWIFNGTSQYCYVYAIKSGTFGKYDFGFTNNVPNAVATAVNYYPDYLLQIGSTIYSLLQRPNINKDGSTTGGIFTPNKYACKMITRPMKLENALALKSIMQVRHITDFSDAAGIALEIYASNNLKTAQNTWVKLGSLRGKPWKYYRFRYDFTNLIATDRFAGSILVTQERRTDKLR